jgi:hypothetical protein
VNKPIRSVRKPKEETEEPIPTTPDRYVEGWRQVIEGVVTLDVEESHTLLERELVIPGVPSGSEILEALNRVQERLVLAKKLSSKARREYEIYKESYEGWLEMKKSAARVSLEEEKKSGALTKQITQDMILDQVRATWPDEYMSRVEKMKDFQAAVHVLEELSEAWRERARSLSAMKDIVLAYGGNNRG